MACHTWLRDNAQPVKSSTLGLNYVYFQPLYNQHLQKSIKTNNFILCRINTYEKQGGGGRLWLTSYRDTGIRPSQQSGEGSGNDQRYASGVEGYLRLRTNNLELPYDLHRSVTGPSIGCSIVAPVRRDSIKFAFSAKYHFAGRSASSISIKRGLYFNPSACRIIVS